MAVIASEGFEGGSHQTPITAGNTSLTGIQGTPVFDNDAIEGDLAGRFAPSGTTGRGDLLFSARSTVWVSYYIKVNALPSSNTFITQFSDGSSQIGDMRLEPSGSLAVRNGFVATIASSQPLTVGQWARIALRIEPGASGGLHLRMYTGANLHGTTPDNGPTGQSANSTVSISQINRTIFGAVNATNFDILLDRIVIDDANEPPPLDVTPDTNTHVRINDAWVPATPYVRTGDQWVPATGTPL